MTPELCTKCGLTYGDGDHEYDPTTGAFGPDGHYFEEKNSEEE